MLCCVVLLAVVGLVFRRGRVSDPLPPPARRTAQGVSVPAAARTEPSPPSGPAATRAIIVRWYALGAVFYIAVVTALLAVGAADVLDGSNLHWFMRDLLYALAAAAGLLLAKRKITGRRPASNQPALALIGAGAAWMVLGVIDQHALVLYEIAHGLPLWDAVFHAAGFWAILGGVLLLHRASTGRSTLGSAHG